MPSWKKLVVSGSDATLRSLNLTENLTVSGSTFFGDTGTDTHTFSGSISVNGEYTLPLTDAIYPNSVLISNGAGTLEFDIPKTIYEEVKNVSGGTLPKGTPVYVINTTGNTNNVAPADATDPAKMPASFILEQALDDDEEGLGIILGFINGIDTSGLVAGQIVYVGPGGGYTQTRPTGSALVQALGIPVRIDPTNGSGIIFNAGVTNDLPNIQEGYFWIGDSNGVPTSASVDSLRSGSFSGSFQGDGSQLTNIPSGDSFPFTGSAIITGSLNVIGTVTTTGNIIPFTGSIYNLGSETNRWNIIYTSDLSLRNDVGDWTIVEGEDDLFLYNNRKGKVYKFNITEVDPLQAPSKKE